MSGARPIRRVVHRKAGEQQQLVHALPELRRPRHESSLRRSGLRRAGAKAVLRGSAMKHGFSTLRPGLILVSSDAPGAHVTMFGPKGERLRFRPDECEFHDSIPSYVWAFEWIPTLIAGQVFVFATTDRTVVGDVAGAEIRVAARTTVIERGDDG